MEKYIAIIWNMKGNLQYQDKIINEIKNNFQITYMFDMKIHPDNKVKFCNLFYYFDNWTYETDRASTTFKVICFNDYKPSIQNMRGRYLNMNVFNLKKKIRNTYNRTSLIHMSDNVSETIHNCSMLYLFQENNIYQNNLIYTIRYENNKLRMKNVEKNILSNLNKKLFNDFIDSIKKCGFNSDDFCISGSFILSIHGLRESKDLDFICLDNDISFTNQGLKNHKEILKDNKTKYTKEDILYNPKHHFLFNGIKCIDLSILKQIKLNRLNIGNKNSSNYEKYKNDVILIHNYIDK